MSFANEIIRDMARGAERSIGLDGTYAGQDFTYTRNSVMAGQQLEVGGKVVTIAFTFTVRESFFSSPPLARQVVTLSGVKHRIIAVKKSPSLTHYEIDVEHAGQP